MYLFSVPGNATEPTIAVIIPTKLIVNAIILSVGPMNGCVRMARNVFPKNGNAILTGIAETAAMRNAVMPPLVRAKSFVAITDNVFLINGNVTWKPIAKMGQTN